MTTNPNANPAALQQALHHALHWFEIPVTDLDRAQTFYEALLAQPLKREVMGPTTLAIFGRDEGGVTGALMFGEAAPQPADAGTLVYLNANPSLDVVLGRVEAAGGRIAMPRMDLPDDIGCIAHFIDTEGNRVGLHAHD